MGADQREPLDVAWARAGRWGATQTALAMLHRRGAIRAGPPGTVTRVVVPLTGAHPLERALFAAAYGSVGPRELMNKPRSRTALSALRRSVTATGLIRPWWRRLLLPAVLAALVAVTVVAEILPIWIPVPAGVLLSGALVTRRTVTGRRTLRALRARHAALLETPPPYLDRLTPDEVGMAVALFGNRALRALMPAAPTGLLDGGRWWTAEPQSADTPVIGDTYTGPP